MKILYCILTFPLQILAKIFVTLNIFKIKEKLALCLTIVDEKHIEIPIEFVAYLTAAEDHRFDHHLGIDQIAIMRAFFSIIMKSTIEGASTIEQQLVRVVTNQYQRTIQRKFIEQLLAISLSSHREKSDIARAYLAIAYYGCDYSGTNGVTKLIGKNLQHSSEQDIASIAARLKYPEPINLSQMWKAKHSCRIIYILHRKKQSANKSINFASSAPDAAKLRRLLREDIGQAH